MRSAGVYSLSTKRKVYFSAGLRTKMISLTLAYMMFGVFVGVYGDEERAAGTLL